MYKKNRATLTVTVLYYMRHTKLYSNEMYRLIYHMYRCRCARVNFIWLQCENVTMTKYSHTNKHISYVCVCVCVCVCACVCVCVCVCLFAANGKMIFWLNCLMKVWYSLNKCVDFDDVGIVLATYHEAIKSLCTTGIIL